MSDSESYIHIPNADTVLDSDSDSMELGGKILAHMVAESTGWDNNEKTLAYEVLELLRRAYSAYEEPISFEPYSEE
jgi:hypothetical protein